MSSVLRRASFVKYRCLRSFATEAAIGHDLGTKPSIFGQPNPSSHPHLLKPNELTPGISPEEYALRRKTLMDSLPESSVVISLASPVKYMSGHIFYKFRQDSNFWYLTGFEEPESAVILEKNSTSKGYRMTMFSTGKDARLEKWNGAKTAYHDVATVFQADEARSIQDFLSHFKSLTSLYSNVYIDLPRRSKRRSKSFMEFLVPPAPLPGSEIETALDSLSSSRRKSLGPELARLRAIKSPAEQRLMRAAADISGRAFAKTMRFTRPGTAESAIEAHFEYLCRLGGAQRLAYVPVVASGPNGIIIHYTANNNVAFPGELVRLDAGCEFNGYASDITRTYPVNGKYSPSQRDLYSAVLAAQKALVAMCTESHDVTSFELHRQSCTLLREELKQIGFHVSSKDLEEVLYTHHLTHPIGIDLHESIPGERTTKLKSGMVITIEPGIYVPPSSKFPQEFHNLGVQIEDEVVIGEKYPTILSIAAPKEIADVEGACQGQLGLEPF